MKRVLFISTLFFFSTIFPCKAQFTLQGSAGIGPSHCSATAPTYKLTDAFGNESGQAWNNIQANLNQPFDVHFQLFLGAQPYHVGADGVAFVFQQQGTNAKGPTGEGLGFAGIQPSLAVEFDTYQNPYDPPYCHTAIEKNGDVDHTDGSGNNLAGPVQLDPSNPTIPDSNWYNMEITWTPKDSTLSVYFNCILRLSYKGDVVNGIFNGNPNVYWGFTAGTGGKDNLQEVCMAVSPAINSNDTTICAGNSIKLIASGGGPYLWSTGDTSSSILVTPAVSTNYFVIISNDTCLHGASATVNVSAYPVPVVSTGATICGGTPVKLSASGGATYSWIPSATLSCNTCSSTEARPNVSTIYTVTIASGPCKVTDSVAINVNPAPVVTACCDSVIKPGQNVQLVSSGIGSFAWSPPNAISCNSCTDPVVNPLTTTTYTLTVTSDSSCSAQQAITIDVSCGTVFIPEAFSPNGDGQNDYLYVRGDCIKTVHFEIFDRWGNKLFETDDRNIPWDGRYKGEAMNAGSYVYYLTTTLYDGTTQTKKGNVTLLR